MNPVEQAANILRRGGLVAFPTETVYGLGADATNPLAVERIFAAKGRPSTNPLIVHVAAIATARQCAAEWPASADLLAGRFWPGPLTLVLRRARAGPFVVADAVAAGGDTIGIRVPNHPMALKLLGAFGGPLAAPSANRSFHVSPTTAEHVRADLGDRVDLILDGGPCQVGIESTVLDLVGEPTILRPGHISQGDIAAVLGRSIRVASASASPHVPARSPGQLEVHYAPALPTFRFDRSERARVEAEQVVGQMVMLLGGSQPVSRGSTWIMPTAPAAYATEMYRVLREMDAVGKGEIWIEMPPDEPAWAAVRDRLRRASRPGKL